MNVASTFRMLAGGLTASLLIGAFGTSAAEARPVKPGGVTNLVGSAVPGSASGTYVITSGWDPAANATKYQVALTKDGVTLASTRVTTTSWSPTVTATPGDASLAVTPIALHRKGATSRVTVHLADVTAPQGSFTSSWTGADATITQQSLSDDSGPAGITRTVDWGDGTVEPWTSGTTINHHYGALGRYTPTVTLSDAVPNTDVVDVPAIVIGDTTAPTGAFTVAPGTAWAAFTAVTVTQTALGDDYSPNTGITRSVDWGDGAVTSDWSGADTISHVYTTAGTFSPTVTLTDEAHNPSAALPTSDVTVTLDSAAPVLKLVLPSALHSVKAWKTLRGKATDAPGTGVKRVSLRAVEKRGTAWYGYRPATKTWVKAATRAGAYQKGRAFTLTTDAQNRWSATLAGLRKGTLIYKVSATDRVKNVSATLTHKATLTRS
jgi:hypothetical protein